MALKRMQVLLVLRAVVLRAAVAVEVGGLMLKLCDGFWQAPHRPIFLERCRVLCI